VTVPSGRWWLQTVFHRRSRRDVARRYVAACVMTSVRIEWTSYHTACRRTASLLYDVSYVSADCWTPCNSCHTSCTSAASRLPLWQSSSSSLALMN